MADTATRTSNQTYDLVSVLSHPLQAGQTHEAYIRDAEGRGDQEVADFFRDVQGRHQEIADRAKALLQSRFN